MTKRLTKEQANAIIQAIEKYKEYDEISKVYLFGSCANGKNTPKSDVDILVLCRQMPEETFREFKFKNDYIDLGWEMFIEMDIRFFMEQYPGEEDLSKRKTNDCMLKLFYDVVNNEKVLLVDNDKNYTYSKDEINKLIVNN